MGGEALGDYVATLGRFGVNTAVLVAEHGKPVFRESSILPIDTPYYVASVTKTFTAAAILRLAHQKRLSLDDPITRFFRDVPEDKRAITVAQLVHHMSGIDHLYSADDAMTRDDAIRAVLATKLVSAPGAEENYSSDGYVLLAAIVEIASGEPFDQFVSREVFRAAGLKNVAFAGACPKKIARTVAPGANGSPCALPAILARRGPAGIIASVDDLFRWSDGVVRRRILGDQLDGWEIDGTWTGHGGDDDAVGHNAMVFYDSAKDRTVVVATNAGEFAGQNFAHVIFQRIVKLLDGASIGQASLPAGSRAVEGQPAIDAFLGAPVKGAAEHNTFVASLLEMLREGKTAEIDDVLGPKRGDYVRRWWTRMAPLRASVRGTSPAWWSTEGGTATFLRMELADKTTTARVEWNEDGTFRALGGAAIPAPIVILEREGEGFDPANGVVVARSSRTPAPRPALRCVQDHPRR
jgi:CubicO group peptidase (beta-lactamase class C family)